MSKHLNFLLEHVDSSAIRATAEGFGLGVALTEDELVTAKAAIIRRWGKVERFPLTSVVGLRTVPNPSANLLQVEFSEGGSTRVLTLMYSSESAPAFERIIGFLRERLADRQTGDADDR